MACLVTIQPAPVSMVIYYWNICQVPVSHNLIILTGQKNPACRVFLSLFKSINNNRLRSIDPVNLFDDEIIIQSMANFLRNSRVEYTLTESCWVSDNYYSHITTLALQADFTMGCNNLTIACSFHDLKRLRKFTPLQTQYPLSWKSDNVEPGSYSVYI